MRGKRLITEPIDQPEVADEVLVVTCELKSGKFFSKIEIPLFAEESAKQRFVEAWLQLMETGMRAGRSAREHSDSKKAGKEAPPAL
jgi:hypothetical protein